MPCLFTAHVCRIPWRKTDWGRCFQPGKERQCRTGRLPARGRAAGSRRGGGGSHRVCRRDVAGVACSACFLFDTCVAPLASTAPFRSVPGAGGPAVSLGREGRGQGASGQPRGAGGHRRGARSRGCPAPSLQVPLVRSGLPWPRQHPCTPPRSPDPEPGRCGSHQRRRRPLCGCRRGGGRQSASLREGSDRH